MDDLISRQAAIAEIMEDIKDRSLHDDPGTPEDYAEGYDEGIRNAAVTVLQMPSAQPGWIPCTPETMPKNKSNVLTVIYIPGRQAHIRSGWYEDGLFMNDNGDTWKATDKEVVGWMYQPKLPNPREGGQDGKN